MPDEQTPTPQRDVKALGSGLVASHSKRSTTIADTMTRSINRVHAPLLSALCLRTIARLPHSHELLPLSARRNPGSRSR